MQTLTYVSRETMTEIADAVRDRTGTDTKYTATEIPAAIYAISATSGRQDVNFVDYDGTLLYSYTLAELAELTELPALPEHDGLICQGWNWTLKKLQAFSRPVTVGAKYITDDGATRLHIHIATTGRMVFPLYYQQDTDVQTTCYSVIDWGDGSNQESAEGAAVSVAHTYSAPGDYTITVTPVGTALHMTFGGAEVLTICGALTDSLYVYLNMIQSVEIGSNMTSIGDSAFWSCCSLASVTIPDGVTSIGNSAFGACCGVAEYYLKPTTPPTLPNTSVFDSIPDDCIIYVPKGKLTTYRAATNWSAYASHMQEYDYDAEEESE